MVFDNIFLKLGVPKVMEFRIAKEACQKLDVPYRKKKITFLMRFLKDFVALKDLLQLKLFS